MAKKLVKEHGVWRFKQIKPQKARGKFPAAKQPPDVQLACIRERFNGPEWVAEEKYDGDRRVGQFCGSVVRITGCREGVKGGFVEKTGNVPHLSNLWPKLDPRTAGRVALQKLEEMKRRTDVLDGTVLDFECVVPRGFVCGAGGRSKHVTSIMGSAADVAIEKQRERGWLRAAVFDCLWFRGEDVRHLTYEQRRSYVVRALDLWRNPHAFIVPSVRGEKSGFLEAIWSAGGEGIVLKHVDHTYGDQTRWIKVKIEINVDVVIMGYKDATAISTKVNGEVSPTKYAERGLIGALVFGQYVGSRLVPMGTTSGMDDDTREYITKNQKKLLGTVFEVKANGREPTGAFRHPQFKRFRPDKSPKDCIYRPDET